MNMRAARVGGQQGPVPVRTNFPDRFQDQAPSLTIQFVGSLLQQFLFRKCPRWIRRKKTASGKILMPIHRPCIVPMQPRAVASEGDQISERDGSFHWFLTRSLTVAARIGDAAQPLAGQHSPGGMGLPWGQWAG